MYFDNQLEYSYLSTDEMVKFYCYDVPLLHVTCNRGTSYM